MVGASGFEPPTSRSRTVRSTKLSHAPTGLSYICGRNNQRLKDEESRIIELFPFRLQPFEVMIHLTKPSVGCYAFIRFAGVFTSRRGGFVTPKYCL
jgi:hypothetical protein